MTAIIQPGALWEAAQEWQSHTEAQAEGDNQANNSLQKVMNWLYLLASEPALPGNAREWVTQAQAEVALVAALLRRRAESLGAVHPVAAAAKSDRKGGSHGQATDLQE